MRELEGNELKKILVSVPFQSSVTYELKVNDPNDLSEIKEKLEEIDPSDWYDDPCFYESLGTGFRQYLERVKRKDVMIE